MLNVVWHLAQVLLASSQTLPSRCFVMALSLMTESALDTTDQMLRTMYPTWWRAFGQKQNLDTSGVGTVIPWWDAWDTDETAAKLLRIPYMRRAADLAPPKVQPCG